MIKTWEKVFEYASMPKHGTLSRQLRKGVKVQINEGRVFENVTLFLGEEFLRLTEQSGEENSNTYFDWSGIVSVRTLSGKE